MFTCQLTVPEARFAQMRSALTTMDGPLAKVGEFMVNKWMPELFRSAGKGTWPAVMRGGEPLLDTGMRGGLLSAFTWSLGVDRKSVIVGNAKPYAKAHNDGMRIDAKNAYKGVPGGPYLAIPLPTLSISQRRIGPSAFSGKKTFIAKSRNGNWMVFETVKVKSGEKKGKTKRAKNKFASRWTPGQTSAAKEAVIRPLFLLRKSVQLKRREFMKWFPEMKEQAIAIARREIVKAMGKAA